MIHFIDVSKYYDNHIIFDQLNCHVPMLSFFWFLGATGSGKTTLIKLLTNQAVPDSGSILLGNRKLGKLRGRELVEHLRQLGIISQEYSFIRHFNVENNLKLPLIIRGCNKSQKSSKLESLTERFDLTYHLKQPITNLSLGEKQLVKIVRGLVHEPLLILADNPFQNLDEHYSRLVMEVLYEEFTQGKTVVIMSQDTRFLNFPQTKIMILDQQRVKPWNRFSSYTSNLEEIMKNT